MSEHRVRLERDGPLALLALDRPDKLNAIDGPMITALLEALETAEADPAVRAIVLHGQGRAFSAGFDLDEAPDEGAGDPVVEELERDFDFLLRFWDARKPVIAAVHGACLGGAFELMLTADLVAVAEDARLGEPEVRFGSGVVAMLLPWFCGPRAAAEVVLRGEDRLDPARALAWGLVNRVVPKEAVMTTARTLALEVARNDMKAVAEARKALRERYDRAGFREALRDGLRRCIEVERHPSEEALAFQERVARDGTAAAVAWLDRRLGLAEDRT